MDDNYRKALEREARLLNSLKHAALPRVSDHFLEDDRQFIVMEYIPGEDLSYILDETGRPFAFEKVIVWADQLLVALEFLHTQSTPVIHRDIKPQNLKTTSQGQIVLLDFGLAKGNPTDAGVQTAAKSIFGYSRNYASLEQIQGTGTDPRSDLYSLAATLYHLATGQAPEDALTRAMAVLSNQPDPLLPANAVNRSIPAGFAGVLQKALDLNAASRPSSAGEMRQMLKQMDGYAHLATDVSGAETIPSVDAAIQKTRLMPGATKQAVDRQTGIKTEVLPAYVSQETAVRTGGGKRATDPEPLAAAAGGFPRRKLAIASAASLLLAGGLAFGAYTFDPSIFSSLPATSGVPQTEETQTEIKAASEPETPPASDILPQNAASADAPTDTAAKEPEAKAGPEKAEGRQPAKTTKTASSNKQETASGQNSEEFDIEGKTIYVGNIKIKDGKVETPDSFIDEYGVTPKVPNVPAVRRNGIPDMRNMTPAQRRKIQEMRRRGLLPPARRPQPPPPSN